MADINFLIPRTGPVQPDIPGSFLRGFAGPLALSGQLTQNALAQEKLKQFQETQNALTQYAKTTGDPLDRFPEIKKAVQEGRATEWTSAWQQIRAFPTLDPAKYPQIREKLSSAGVPENLLPPPDAIKTPQDMQNFYYGGDMMNAQIKAISKGPMSIGAGGLYNPLTGVVTPPATKPTTLLSPEGQSLGQFSGKVQVLPKGFKPELLVPVTGKGSAIAWTPGTPVPEGFTKASAVGSKLSEDNMASILEGLKQGNIDPGQLSKRGQDYNTIIAKANKEGVSVGQLALDWKNAGRLGASLNSTQMLRFNTLSTTVMGTIDRVISLSDQLKMSGVPLANAAKLGAIRNVEGNSPTGQLIGQYMAAITTLKEEYANFAQGGFAPTESAFKLGDALIKENYGSAYMKAALEETKRLVNIRRNAFQQAQVTKVAGPGNKGTQPAGVWNAPPPQTRTTVNKFVGPGKYNGKVIHTQEEYNQEFGQ